MRIAYRSRARDDIAYIYEYRSEHHSHEVGARIEQTIRAAIEMLASNPEFGLCTNHHRQLRRWPMPEYPYTIFYTVDWPGDTLTVIRVIDSGRVRNLRRLRIAE